MTKIDLLSIRRPTNIQRDIFHKRGHSPYFSINLLVFVSCRNSISDIYYNNNYLSKSYISQVHFTTGSKLQNESCQEFYDKNWRKRFVWRKLHKILVFSLYLIFWARWNAEKLQEPYFSKLGEFTLVSQFIL